MNTLQKVLLVTILSGFFIPSVLFGQSWSMCKKCDKIYELPSDMLKEIKRDIEIGKVLDNIISGAEYHDSIKQTLSVFSSNIFFSRARLTENLICKAINCMGEKPQEARIRIESLMREIFGGKPIISVVEGPDGTYWRTVLAIENIYGSMISGDKGYRLYTFDAANEVCQTEFGEDEGWRLPTDEEFKKKAQEFGGLIDFVENKTYGYPLTGFSRMKKEINANYSGAIISNRLIGRGQSAYFWTSTNSGDNYAFRYSVSADKKLHGGPHLGRMTAPKSEYASVICVTDEWQENFR